MNCKKLRQLLGLSIISLFVVSCQSDTALKEKMTKIIEENPEVITKAIEKNPVAFVEAFQKAVRSAQGEMAKKREEEEKKEMVKLYDNPLEPMIRKDESFRGGPKDAPLTLVEYSDFQCPYCKRGFETVLELIKEYKGKIRFVYKHLPLSFHKEAKLASQYYEAIRLQDEQKAFEFHDVLYDKQPQIKKGDAFLKVAAKKVGANMSKLEKDLNSEKVMQRIAQDEAEAQKFGMQGTPGFILNGIPVRGAYPKEHFVGIVEELKKRGKLNL